MKLSGDNAALALKKLKIYPTLAFLCLLAALWFAWQGWKASAADSLTAEVDRVRADVAATVGAQARAAIDRLETSRSRIALTTALKRNEMATARAVIADGWAGLEEVEWHDPNLRDPYANAAEFGYGKLGILEGALQQNTTQAAVVKDAGGQRLGLAAPVLEDGRVVTLVYVRLPIDSLAGPIQSASLPGGYLALRQGRYTITQAGNTDLATMAESGAVRVAGTPMRVVAAAPLVAGGPGVLPSILLAVLSVLAALALLLVPRLKGLRIQRHVD
ncbi:MAG: hypothetical protein ACK40L_17545, partial [Hydrogenophaga sp.]